MKTKLTAKYEATKKPPQRSRRVKFMERAMDFQVPALPHKVRTVLAMSTSMEINATRLAREIQRDFGMTLRFYRVLNSAFFSPGRRQVLSMRFITVLLGQDNLLKIIAGTPVLPVTHQEEMAMMKYALIFIARSLASAELAFSLADNYNMKTEKIVPCTMFCNLGKIFTAFLSFEAGKLLFEARNPADIEKRVKKITGWVPTEFGIALARRWNLPDLIIKTLYPFNDVKQGLSRDNYKIVLMAHAANRIIDLAGSKGGTRRQKDIHALMIKKLGVSRKGVGKAFQEGIQNFGKENLFFYELLDQNGLLQDLLV